MDSRSDKGSTPLAGLLQGSEHLPAQVELLLNGSSCRVLGGCTASASSVMVLCNCAACGARPVTELFRNGGRVMTLHEWCMHTSLQGASLDRLFVRQPAADYPVPLPAWLRAAALHMGGEALKRKQLSIYWWDTAPDGPAPTVPLPPCQRLLEQKRACGAWRPATVVGFEPLTGVFTLKYHADPKKQVSQVYLPLALVHFARMAPPPGAPPRNVAEGCSPLPPVLLPPPDNTALVGSAAAGAGLPPQAAAAAALMAPVPTHPVLLNELHAQQQQMFMAIRQQQQQRLQQLQLQELQHRLCQVPQVNLPMTKQQQLKPPQPLAVQPPLQQQQQPSQQQERLQMQLRQHYLQQQYQQQQSQLEIASSCMGGSGVAGGVLPQWPDWLRKRRPSLGAADSTGDSSPVGPGSLVGTSPSPIYSSAATAAPPPLDTDMLFGGTAATGGFQPALSRFGSSTDLMQTAAAAPAPVPATSPLSSTSAVPELVGLPAFASSASAFIATAGEVWEPLNAMAGTEQQLHLQLRQPLAQRPREREVDSGPEGVGLRAAGRGACSPHASSFLDTDVESLFQVLEHGAWANNNNNNNNINSLMAGRNCSGVPTPVPVAVPVSRADSGPVPPASTRGQLPPPQPSPAMVLQPQFQQQLLLSLPQQQQSPLLHPQPSSCPPTSPWWAGLSQSGGNEEVGAFPPLLPLSLSLPLPPGTASSPHKRHKLLDGSSNSSLHSCIANPHGAAAAAARDCEWISLLEDARLFD